MTIPISSSQYSVLKVENGYTLFQTQEHTSARKIWVFEEKHTLFAYMVHLIEAEITPIEQPTEIK